VSVQVGKDKLNLNLHTTENVGYDPATKKYYDLTIKDEALVGTLQQESPSTTGKKSYDVLGGKTWDTDAYFLGNFVEGLTYAAWVITFTKALGSIMPKGEYKNMFDVVGYSAVAGIMAGYVLYGLGERITGGKSGDLWTGFSVVAGIATAYFIFAKNYIKYDYKEETLVFKCLLWQAPNGGKDCDKCNQDALKPCSEYRCKSLGQSCMLINAGTGKERCINSNPNDVTSPGIKPWINILTKGYAYTDVKERPPGGEVTAGMRITYKGGCLPAFTPFKFGIVTTDNGNNGVILQPAQCKIEYNHTKNFEEMGYYLGDENIYLENHSQAISLPGAKLINTTFPGVKNDNEYTLYIRCKDGNGNANRDEFAVRFCIDPTPDLTAPIIKSTSIASGSAVQYKADNVSISVYTNEPSKCRWSRKDASYDNMENSMNCNNQLWQMNAEMSYTCNTLLTSIKDKQENQFYFRCQDLNNNTQQQSYPYLLYGSQPLTILSTGPTGTIGSSTSTAVVSLSVKTDNGFKNGNSDCYYSTSDSNNSYIKMFQTGGNNHKQDLDLSEGSYKYYIKCADAGGNSASNSTEFKVFTDTYAPAIIRTINYEGKLVVITDEESTCKYSTDSCNFNINSEGIDMPYQNSNTHYAEWKTDQTYYIKCSDKFNNQPEPSECSMTIKPYKINED
jgi:hypothetical protein